MDDFWSTIGAVLLVIMFLIGGMVLLGWMQENSRTRTEQHCIEQFGQGWIGKSDAYGPDFCVNKDGEVKYPYER